MMRVIAGTARSLPLKTIEGKDTRPTTDRIKETLFNMIQLKIPEAVVLDLFSGSGAIGIEALSRGAKEAYFVENNKAAVSCIRDNLSFTKLNNQAVVMECDAITALRRLNGKGKIFDIIFMDPPYQGGYEAGIFRTLREMPYVTENTVIILEAEAGKNMDFLKDLGFEAVREKKYRTNKHVFIKKL